jgi:hypothetical protein
MSGTRFRIGLWPLLSLCAICIVTSALMLAVRFYIVEPEAVAQACATKSEGWRCMLREWAVFGFLRNLFGATAIVAGVLATVSRWRWLALPAILSGIAGAVLYTFELSGAGLLLGALVWVHRAPSAAYESTTQGGDGHQT